MKRVLLFAIELYWRLIVPERRRHERVALFMFTGLLVTKG